MKNVIAWMKTNPISVASFVLMVASVGAIAYFMFVANPALQASAEKPANQKLNQIKALMRQSVDVPPSNADDPPESRSVTITPAVIEVLDGIYTDLNRESEDIFAAALGINKVGHSEMLPGLFPDTPNDKKFRAQTVYGQLLSAMMGTQQWSQEVAQNTGIAMPYLNAQPPLSPEYIQSFLAEKVDALARENSLGGALSEAKVLQQQKEQQRELINELLVHAQGINIYADPELGNMLTPNPAFPLQIASLGSSAESPTPSQLWEGQLELWILQDIVQAIFIANDVANQRKHFNAEGKEVPSSVLNAPVKRLIRAEVIPGYVGLHDIGGIQNTAGFTNTSSAKSKAGVGGAAGYPPPAGGMTDKPRETKISENFAFGPTGRSSNGLYDVRHARVIAHVDYQRLPEFLNSIARVNLMTVLNVNVQAVDEYELLHELYMYGQGDVVEVELIIESLWLREWTAELMPEDTKRYVGLLEPAEGTGVPGFPGGGNPYGGDPYGGGGYGGDPYGGNPYGGY
ncbi:hypothetical protein [Algisphaera agarilytica]|uniref:Uncharacterized protein n=1 Tax=Algisphaera agarilytica TaxID=1385975 RepID=A0A7X0H7Q9_9BACT|nr:hypothetical protein [Algisphaera agarilytica]MBB6430796.1 hypothetical protein [Algisphaera agarilytica]